MYRAGKGPATGGADLEEPWKTNSTMTWHIEGHAAALMRQQDIKNAVLYINTVPCKRPKGWPAIKGCDETLKDILPAGYTLTVFLRDGSYTYGKAVFRGNGKGLKDT